MDKTLKILTLSTIVAVALALTTGVALAADDGLKIPKVDFMPNYSPDAPADIVTGVLNWFFIIAGILCIVIIVWAGITYATAGGDEEKVSKAKTRLIYGIIGVAVIIAAFAITQFIKSTLGGDVPEAPSL